MSFAVKQKRQPIVDAGEQKQAKKRPGPDTVFHKPALVVFTPRLFWVPDAARYLSTTIWHIEELIRHRTLVSFIEGRRRVIHIDELNRYADQRSKEAKEKQTQLEVIAA